MIHRFRFVPMAISRKLTADDGDDLDDQDGGYWEDEINKLDDR